MTKLFIQSCHASLEYDHARMFRDLGYEVFGEFDIGSNQRPKIPGVTDVNSNINDFDFIVLHEVPNYTAVMENLLRAGKRVVLIGFGQSDTWQYEFIARLCREYPHAYVAPYAIKDHRLYQQHGAPDHKNRLIYFGKYMEDYQPWVGTEPVCYATCNSIHRRGHGCGWPILEKIRSQIPLVLSGKDTEEVGGLGEISEPDMRERLRTSACFLSFGTVPAALVMTQMEAWCAGCPTVCYNNGHGLAEEKFNHIMETTAEKLVMHVKRLVHDANHRNLAHMNSLENAKRFDVKNIGPQWVELIKEILA